MPIIDTLQGVNIQVDNWGILDEVMQVIDCYTRPDADDLIVDTAHLDEDEIREQFQKITGIEDDVIEQNQLLVLWR